MHVATAYSCRTGRYKRLTCGYATYQNGQNHLPSSAQQNPDQQLWDFAPAPRVASAALGGE